MIEIAFRQLLKNPGYGVAVLTPGLAWLTASTLAVINAYLFAPSLSTAQRVYHRYVPTGLWNHGA
jgi:hypothetical protein